jgi:hypothetical protein
MEVISRCRYYRFELCFEWDGCKARDRLSQNAQVDKPSANKYVFRPTKLPRIVYGPAGERQTAPSKSYCQGGRCQNCNHNTSCIFSESSGTIFYITTRPHLEFRAWSSLSRYRRGAPRVYTAQENWSWSSIKHPPYSPRLEKLGRPPAERGLIQQFKISSWLEEVEFLGLKSTILDSRSSTWWCSSSQTRIPAIQRTRWAQQFLLESVVAGNS